MKLSKDKLGRYRPNIGFVVTSNGNRTPKRFVLGTKESEANRRAVRLHELWEHVKSQQDKLPVWDSESLWIAKQLALGETQIRIGAGERKPMEWVLWREKDYARKVNLLTQRYPMINFVASDREMYDTGQALFEKAISTEASQIQQSGLVPTTEPVQLIPTDGTLHQAFEKYMEWIDAEYFSSEENATNDNGVAKKKQVKSLMIYVPDQPLATLDTKAINKIVTKFRKRPINSLTKGKLNERPLARSYCAGLIKEFFFFLERWLHFHSPYSWTMPADAHLINRKVEEFDSDVEKEGVEVPVYNREQLAILNRFATPLERLFLLLALNCAYGADQSGRLKIREVRLDARRPYTKRVRRKKKVKACHRLWGQTIEGLKWAFSNHPTGDKTSYLILKTNGSPYWRKTKGGNRAKDIPKLFEDLVERIQKDYPEFPWLGFNALRDTSIDIVRRLAGEEMASTHAAHAHQSPDRNLRRYSNPRIKKLFTIHQKLEVVLADVLAAAPDEPFKPQRQAYISVRTNELIDDLIAKGEKVTAIATTAGVSQMTVYRRINERREQESNGDTQ